MTVSNSVTHALAYGFALLSLGGVGYLLLSIFCAMRWKTAKHPAPGKLPPISILKSLRGKDRAMFEAFRSHCQLDYPQFELIFGVGDANDEAVAEVERLKREFPWCNIELVICPERLGPNGKVSTLAQMLPHTKYSIVLINDSDITVQPDYLKKIAAEFTDEKVGMVTTLYRAEAGSSLASRIEALTISTDFAAGVLTARVVEGGLHFALGSTIAIRRSVLELIGGLTPLVDYLADDYELGARTAIVGYKVVLADTVVETHLPSYGFGGMIEHQLRWARTIRDRRMGGYLGLLFTFAVPWAVFTYALLPQARASLSLMAAAIVIRLIQAWVVGVNTLHDRRIVKDLWMVPFRDFVALYVWIASFASNEVTWRGLRFRVRDGKLFPA